MELIEHSGGMRQVQNLIGEGRGGGGGRNFEMPVQQLVKRGRGVLRIG